MIRYQERTDFYDMYLYADKQQRKELLNYEIASVRDQIVDIEEKIDALGFSWFGEKKIQKRKYKAELKELRERLKHLRDLQNIGNWHL